MKEGTKKEPRRRVVQVIIGILYASQVDSVFHLYLVCIFTLRKGNLLFKLSFICILYTSLLKEFYNSISLVCICILYVMFELKIVLSKTYSYIN